jgi:hypothetical protein
LIDFQALPAGVSLDVAIAREKLEEIACGKQGRLKPGKFGRDQQWMDAAFPMTSKSIGRTSALPLIKSWKEARAINADCELFAGGTDPDDVHQGRGLDVIMRGGTCVVLMVLFGTVWYCVVLFGTVWYCCLVLCGTVWYCLVLLFCRLPVFVSVSACT